MEEGADPRTDWISDRVCSSMKLKTEKWKKMFGTEENTKAIVEFLDNPETKRVIFFLNGKEDLAATNSFPSGLKKKSVYFIKHSETAVSLETMKELSYGDIGPQPLENLQILLDEVYAPLLLNKKNQKKWPDVVTEDLLRHFQKLVGNVHVTIGQTKGQTLLHLPITQTNSTASMENDKSAVHAIESVVIDWTRQIRAVAKADSESTLENGAHQGPIVELDFWATKEANLLSINEQLNSEKVKSVVKVLELSRSSYYPSFIRIREDVQEALTEASDNNKFLSTLRPHLENLRAYEYPDISQTFPGLLHTLVLVWTHSIYYPTPAHGVMLIREICDDLINISRNYLDPSSIVSSEPQEATTKLALTMKNLASFRKQYDRCRSVLEKQEDPARRWSFENDVVFDRLQLFADRVSQLQEVMSTIVEFSKLERVEIGGTRGALLSAQVSQVFEDFTHETNAFLSISYDVLSPEETRFDDDLRRFRVTISDLEARLLSLLTQSFDDCASVDAIFKLLDSFEGLLQRELLAREFSKKYQVLVKLFSADLEDAFRIFASHRRNPPVHDNMPPVAGVLWWSTSLKDRVELYYSQILKLDSTLLETDDGKDLMRRYELLVFEVREFEAFHFERWKSTIGQVSTAKLNENVINRVGTDRLKVNFDPELVKLLREVKYLKLLGLRLPELAEDMYNQASSFRSQIENFDVICNRYNKLQEILLSVERPLIQDKLDIVEEALDNGISNKCWKDEDLNSYVSSTFTTVNELCTCIDNVKRIVKEIEAVLEAWYTSPLLTHKDVKKLLNLEDEDSKMQIRYANMQGDGDAIRDKLSELSEVFGVSAGEDWNNYVQFINDIMVQGFSKMIKNSITHLLSLVNPAKGASSMTLLEVKIELVNAQTRFKPPLRKDRGSIEEIAAHWMEQYFHGPTVVTRLDCNENFYSIIAENPVLFQLKDRFILETSESLNKCQQVFDGLMKYRDLWEADMKESLNEFLEAMFAVDETSDADAAAEEDETSKPARKEVDLAAFEKKIVYYNELHDEVSAIVPQHIFGWLRVDCKPLKQSLKDLCRKWAYQYTQYLSDMVTNSLAELKQFISDVNAGLAEEVKPGDYHGLVASMGHLLSIRARTEEVDSMFEPRRETIQLLKRFGVQMSEETLQNLENVPLQWSSTKKLYFTVKDQLAPLQIEEAGKVKQMEDAFEDKAINFRQNFKKTAPFVIDMGCDKAFECIDQFYRETMALREEAEAIQKEERLFELSVRDYREIKDCFTELALLKTVWDFCDLVAFQFSKWDLTPWEKIDTEYMEDACKTFVKELRVLPKSVRSWGCYTGLDSNVKNFMTTLPLVTDLRSPAMRDRHWKQLMKATDTHFVINDEFKLQDLLALKLHEYVDDVGTIVDRASKELIMERQLDSLEKNWRDMTFTFTKDKSGEVPLVVISEELVELLEDNQMLLQNMMTSKYIAHFQEPVHDWHRKLGNVDAVVTVWTEVQRTWSHLESIFIGSADIRSQLPEDSKRFDGIDADWKEFSIESAAIPNVVECCNRDGVIERLENMETLLGMCEKALADYLETKRTAFPRFYFISSTDLLDILSKGNIPTEVQWHCPKLFDNMQKLEFQDNDDGSPSKLAVGMYSKEDEYVPFSEPCDCSGAVEEWLNRLVDTMRATLRVLLAEGVSTYEEKPREQWMFDNCAQISLVAASYIWYTTEVNIAFERLEEGNENALKDHHKKIIDQLVTLITIIQGEMSANDRQMIMTICTIDTHSRDTVGRLITEKVESGAAFQWQSQLRVRWDDEKNDCFANICDAQFPYTYEYLGCTPRLVITPLTDRCYITLTQSLHLVMGGAPAGPAGTGKTETTKDLGRALGMMVYVFNCSEQMDYKSMGNIFKGLSSSGSWGCFDEFNRISIEVLSVVATQVKSILDAIRTKKDNFLFQGEEIVLKRSCGVFITMNPGYAGRTELPENIKALFRSVSMVVPDLLLICEIMLMAEGFVQAKDLAKKFTTLYSLCRELLSKQDHYDWGLRAIKSVLVVAGGLKRAEVNVEEEFILMRSLRDFNLPKIVTEDVEVFLPLINDLFPKVEIARKRNLELEEVARKVIHTAKLQPEEGFILKMQQLEELLAVRHCVFVMGPAGAGKSKCWKMLAESWKMMGKKTTTVDLNPKAVTSNELYGYINPSTREWKDGLYSVLMRDLSQIPNKDPKWIILDGDIDPNWIESLNTVMDDNKVLTLASNERIPLHPHMRLIFEIAHLKYATPATVSRAGILYINETDVGWLPYAQSWIEAREQVSERSHLTVLFERYVTDSLSYTRKNFKYITEVSDFNKVFTLCSILQAILTEENVKPGSEREIYELYFVFAAVWAFGGGLANEGMTNFRNEFSKWWRIEWKAIKFPDAGLVYDYYIDPATQKFASWTDMVLPYEHNPELPLQSVLVHNEETTQLKYQMDLLTGIDRPVLLVGSAGSGKTVLIRNKLDNLNEELSLSATINFNNYSDSASLQFMMEQMLEKKTGRLFGPPGQKKLIYYVDDLNMPGVDLYGTQQPITLLRQHLDYSHWYDRAKFTLKEVKNCTYIASMNPKAGSFVVNSRMQRHFATFAVSFPTTESLRTIYGKILAGHLETGFDKKIVQLRDKLLDASLELHEKVTTTFLPTAIKFHYQFNLRDLTNVFSGVLWSSPDVYKTPTAMARLLLHEAERTYCDRLLNEVDQELYKKMNGDIRKKYFDDLGAEEMAKSPLLVCHFAASIGDKVYNEVPDFATLRKNLEESLEQYNDVNAVMNLVLFEDAIGHILRINRIIENPRGNALLVGVGGSGKQSLARLAAHIGGFETFQISISKTYGVTEFKADLLNMYMKTGTKGVPMIFLFTDLQIVNERFLVYINDLLSSGNIPDLFTPDDRENIINAVRGEVKSAGLIDTRDNCWAFFIDKVRRNLKCVLCFSPVGDSLRVRARRFPALVNCTIVDWFHPWPQEALLSVAAHFLEDIELGTPEAREGVVGFMAYSSTSVDEACNRYRELERRNVYTTPKSFLELIKLYKNMLSEKRSDVLQVIERLETGLLKLDSTAKDVAELKEQLQRQQVIVEERKQSADKLLVEVGAEKVVVDAEVEVAEEEEGKANVIKADVAEKADSCAKDLARAEPAIIAAEEALNTLNKPSLTEMKSFTKPAKEVVDVASAVMCLMEAVNGIPPKDRSWNAAKKMMAQVDRFLEGLLSFDKENISPKVQEEVKKYTADPSFNYDNIKTKSVAAAGLCSWVVNIMIYYEIFCDVQPKRDALAAANETLAAAEAKLAVINKKVNALKEKLQGLQNQFEQATNEKNEVIAQAEKTQQRLDLAERLVGGLGSEKVRWTESIRNLRKQEETLVGDVLLASAFVSYIGPFSKTFRLELQNDKWRTFLQAKGVPMSEGVDPLSVLTDDAEIASWNNENLPTDRISVENAAIITSCERWPLIIDPQLQGVAWIKSREADNNLKIIRLTTPKYLDILENAIMNGEPVLIENIGEDIDAVLDPVIGRNTFKKGRNMYVKLGDKEVEYDKRFRLFMQTKLANPHYKPEYQAQCTLVNFTVTEDGLEDQLLAYVVNKERPDLEVQKQELMKQQNEFKIKLKELEDSLLARLSAAEGDILADVELIENLEITKKTATEIAEKVIKAKQTEIDINNARENYRPVAARAAMLYFLLNDLWRVDYMYQFSLKSFISVFARSFVQAEAGEDINERVNNLIDTTTRLVYSYTARGLFERHKLVFSAQLASKILGKLGELEYSEFSYLLRGPQAPAEKDNPVSDWLSEQAWLSVAALQELEAFTGLANDIEGSAKRWREWCEAEAPENEKLPQEWKNKTGLQKLCILRALRPDRVTQGVHIWVAAAIGDFYVASPPLNLNEAYQESDSATPILFILSPGVDPLKITEALGKKLGYSIENSRFRNVSLGQGQEPVAEKALDAMGSDGGWVFLENIHLTVKWMQALEKKLEVLSEDAHDEFRVFLSAEPSPYPDKSVPPGILQNCIKITNEPPAGLKANMFSAIANFNQETLEMCSKQNEFKSILFSLCFFHAAILVRRKFGPQGWNISYPFNTGDLTISAMVLFNYLENNQQIPWEDLRYMFGEIMYGGHISDDWDRRLCTAYLKILMRAELFEEMELAPGFPCPPPSSYDEYKLYIEEILPSESPVLFGMHSNAEITFLTELSVTLCRTVQDLQPKTGQGEGGMTREDSVKQFLEDVLDRLPDNFDMLDMYGRVEERTPYTNVCLQECDRMNILLSEVRRSLKELGLGLKGDLTISDRMEDMMNAIFVDRVPDSWAKVAYPSLKPLGLWIVDLLARQRQLEAWSADLGLPPYVWLSGLFNPQSFLRAIMQATARKNEWPLDKMALATEVTKKSAEEITAAPREGAYVSGLYLEGCRWDSGTGMLRDSFMKDLYPALPAVYLKPITVDKMETKDVYACPLYATRRRGPTYTWTFNLRTKESETKWILAGVAMLLAVD